MKSICFLGIVGLILTLACTEEKEFGCDDICGKAQSLCLDLTGNDIQACKIQCAQEWSLIGSGVKSAIEDCVTSANQCDGLSVCLQAYQGSNSYDSAGDQSYGEGGSSGVGGSEERPQTNAVVTEVECYGRQKLLFGHAPCCLTNPDMTTSNDVCIKYVRSCDNCTPSVTPTACSIRCTTNSECENMAREQGQPRLISDEYNKVCCRETVNSGDRVCSYCDSSRLITETRLLGTNGYCQ